MKYIDISVSIRPDLPVWKGDPAVSILRESSIAGGDAANITHLNMGAHTGTHVDAPLHFLDGRRGVDRLDLDVLVGPAWVAEFGSTHEITAADFEKAEIPVGTARLILKTRNSRLWSEKPTVFDEDFIGISLDGAEWLVQRGVRLVGIDYLGVERSDSVSRGAPVHKRLLSAEIILVEGLDLSEVQPGAYGLMCLPVKIRDADGAPCRAILTRD
ncbi:kynurenine formamidase [Longilinea arvoryzae]|uniref:Kynurenine formamidase n=1 Tax=Longilinea arvoryzae TaxID=360412 RepID=A0A0S7BND6_9CHLR|nr:cyclase family protein [Longilinea arvoryzae]GAP15349.1 kynurenine formamidase [Longilinea arvoryzae]